MSETTRSPTPDPAQREHPADGAARSAAAAPFSSEAIERAGWGDSDPIKPPEAFEQDPKPLPGEPGDGWGDDEP